MDGLGDLSWEVSGLSQVKCGTVVCTVVRVPDGSGAAGLGRDGGVWHVDDVTVLFRLDRGEQHACGYRVVDWGLAWGQPSGWEVGNIIDSSRGLSVPGSEGGKLVGWHVEFWDVGTVGHCGSFRLVTYIRSCYGGLEGSISS